MFGLQAEQQCLAQEVQKLRADNARLAAEVNRVKQANAALANAAVAAPASQPATVQTPPADPPARAGIPGPLTRGDVRIAIASAEIANVQLKETMPSVNLPGQRPPKPEATTDKFVCIQLTVTNTSDARKLTYDGWNQLHAFQPSSATLKDNIGNTYKRIEYRGFKAPLFHVENPASLYPGKAVTDTLVFELPIGKAENLILTLPLQNIGMEGQAELTIPVSAIKRR